MTNRTKYIAGGWAAFSRQFVPLDTPRELTERLREAYFAGASVLFHVMIAAPDTKTDEATDGDIQFMADIQAETDAFGQEMDVKYLTTGRRQ